MRSALNAIQLATGVAAASPALADFKAACESLSQSVPDAGRVMEATFVPAGSLPLAPLGPPGAATKAPHHCLVRGKIQERKGEDASRI